MASRSAQEEAAVRLLSLTAGCGEEKVRQKITGKLDIFSTGQFKTCLYFIYYLIKFNFLCVCGLAYMYACATICVS